MATSQAKLISSIERLRASGLWDVLAKINTFLATSGKNGYLVGGFVRDVILNRNIADIDIAVSTDALAIGPKIADAIGGTFFPLDTENRVCRIVLQDKIEIDLSSFAGSIEKDLAKRDFRINAMAVELPDLLKDAGRFAIIDPFNGRRDLISRRITALSDDVFVADPVRLLRAVRISGELDFKVARHTQTLMRRDACLINNAAGERIREELLRILAVPDGITPLKRLNQSHLLTAIFPELADTIGVEQPKEHHWDVFMHLLKTAAAVDFLLRRGSWEYFAKDVIATVPWNIDIANHFGRGISQGSTRGTMLKLTGLLHDIAKPKTKFVDETGRTRFFGHAHDGALLAGEMLSRLRFSSKEVNVVQVEIENHMRPGQMNQQEMPTQRAIYRFFRDTGENGIDILFLSLADHLAARGPDLDLQNWRQHTSVIEYVLDKSREQSHPVEKQKLIDGNDLIQLFGLEPGPKIGKILESVLESQAVGEIQTKEDALKLVRTLLKAET